MVVDMKPTDSRFELPSGAFLRVEGDAVIGDLRPAWPELSGNNDRLPFAEWSFMDHVLNLSSVAELRLEILDGAEDPEGDFYRVFEDDYPSDRVFVVGHGWVSRAQHVAYSIARLAVREPVA